METLITGAGGLLGNHLTRLFLFRGHGVRVMIEQKNADDGLDGLEIEKIICDIRDPMQVKGCASGMDVVVHAAADTSTWPNNSDKVRNVNVLGTEHLIEEALRSDIKRFIYVSSASVFDWGSCRYPGTETSGKRRFNYNISYYESKHLAQEAVLRAVREKGLSGIVVNPTFMVGPYDDKMNAARLVSSIINRKVPGYPPGGRNFVHAGDVARAIYNAVESGTVGECYILGNENLSYRKFFETVGKVSGLQVPMLPIPAFLVCLTGLVQTMIAYISGSSPQICYNMARGPCQRAYYSSEKARKYLQLSRTPISIAIQETIEWLEKHKNNGHV
jgi:dihydroflavonol-4-reductase